MKNTWRYCELPSERTKMSKMVLKVLLHTIKPRQAHIGLECLQKARSKRQTEQYEKQNTEA